HKSLARRLLLANISVYQRFNKPDRSGRLSALMGYFMGSIQSLSNIQSNTFYFQLSQIHSLAVGTSNRP
ncbi:MAG: hypothetical protein ACKN82_13015, partial [Pirellula sp.]